MQDDVGTDDVRGAVLRLAGEIAAVRQSMTDKSIDIVERLESLGARHGDLEDRMTGIEHSLRGLEERVGRVPAAEERSGERVASAPAGVDGSVRAEALVARVGDEVRDVLATETALTRQQIRDAIDAQGDRDERTIGAGLTRLAQRVGEELANLRQDLLGEIESWFEELPSETRLRDISDRLDDLATRDDDA